MLISVTTKVVTYLIAGFFTSIASFNKTKEQYDVNDIQTTIPTKYPIIIHPLVWFLESLDNL